MWPQALFSCEPLTLIHFYGHRVVLGSNEHSGHRVTGENISHPQILVVITYEHLGHRVTVENISHLQILVVILYPEPRPSVPYVPVTCKNEIPRKQTNKYADPNSNM